MNNKDLFRAIGKVDEEYLKDTEKKVSSPPYIKILVAAAACAVVCIVGIVGFKLIPSRAKDSAAANIPDFMSDEVKSPAEEDGVAECAPWDNVSDEKAAEVSGEEVAEQNISEKPTEASKASFSPSGTKSDRNDGNSPDSAPETVVGYTSAAKPYNNANNTNQFIRTGYTDNNTNHVLFIRSRKELEQYCRENEAELGSKFNDSSFIDSVSGYDDSFFEKNSLVIAVTTESSGSVKYTGCYVGDGFVSIERIIPEVVTCDMACWHTVIPLDKDNPIFRSSPEDIEIILSE